MIRRPGLASFLACSILVPSLPLAAQVTSGDDFDASVAGPAVAPAPGPVVLVDEAHRNLHTATGRYAAFASVATADGFRVEPGKSAFAPDAMPDTASILVVANAAGAAQPSDPAMTDAEIAALVTWVERGGALFLIADHAPFGTATATATRAFGVESRDGHVEDAENAAPGMPGPYFLVFSKSNALLGEHAIVAGRTPGERIESVVSFGGQALEPAPEVRSLVVLLRFGPNARIHSAPNAPDDRVEPVGGRAQMVVLERGEGRVVIAGEAGMFSAQTIRGEAAARAGVSDPFHFGMSHPGGQNKQLLLNTLRWLARKL